MNETKTVSLKQLPVCCPHLHHKSSVCFAATELLGDVFHTKGSFCNIACSKYGPNLGREVKDIDLWTRSVFKSRYSILGRMDFIKKISSRFRRGHIAVPPKDIDDLRKAFSFTKKITAIKSVAITGSAVSKGAPHPHKDFDIVIVIGDLKTYVDNIFQIRSLLPREINGTPVEYFFKTVPATFMASVDLWDLTLYKPKGSKRVKAGKGISKTVECECPIDYDSWIEKTILAEAPEKMGVGDLVEAGIKKVTKGKIKPCSSCKKRRDMLNKIPLRVGSK